MECVMFWQYKLIFVTTTTILKEFFIYMGLELKNNDFKEKKYNNHIYFQ